MQSQSDNGAVAGIGAGGVDDAMREMEKAHGLIYHTKPQRHQGINTSGNEAVCQQLGEHGGH